jgi:hypothetical protein
MKTAADYERQMLELYSRSTDNKNQSFEGQVCPSTDGHPCRLDDLCKEVLWDKNIPDNDPLRRRASDLNRKERYYSNVYFVANPSEVILLEYGVKLFNQLIAFQMDPMSEVKYFFDAKKGRNLLVSKTQGATKRDVEYKVTPRINVTAIAVTPLTKLYDLSNIVALIKSGSVKPLYQSKLDKSTEIRVLPSWLGPQSSIFFSMVKYHYNISAEDFQLCQDGKINPVSNPYGNTQAPYEIQKNVNPAGPQPPEHPYPQVDPSVTIAAEIEQLEKESGLVVEVTENPICFALYDAENVKCLDCISQDECENERATKLAKRVAARKLSAPGRKTI